MDKYAINKTRKSNLVSSLTEEIAELGANASPLTRLFAKKIMSFYSPAKEPPVLTAAQQRIQNVFNSFPYDDCTRRLAALTAAFTEFTPKIVGVPQDFSVGRLFKYSNEIYAIIFNSGSYVYGINAKATGYSYINIQTKIGPDTQYFVNTAEAGLYAKTLLSVDGSHLLGYIGSTVAGSLTGFLKAIEADGTI